MTPLFLIASLLVWGCPFGISATTHEYESYYYSELTEDDPADYIAASHTQVSPLPISYIDPDELPASFSWANVDGQGLSYLTKSLNQQ